ncbi:hypothetical protein [Oceaniglobus trochenteri]|uniref:hypothetical protein n=1 Tax=Oceaniglobus trochenteri TaxID=2763260 RepID=UPI001CFF580E|nr:hypothetical protein [Oceaniglobus trochenteri]
MNDAKRSLGAVAAELSEAIAQLVKDQETLDARAADAQAARSAETDALNRLNATQKAIDRLNSDLCSLSSGDWNRRPMRDEANSP